MRISRRYPHSFFASLRYWDGVIPYWSIKTRLKVRIEENPEAYLGKAHVEKFGTNLGVLAKFLDSAEKLPVQCHPDKKAAKEFFKSEWEKALREEVTPNCRVKCAGCGIKECGERGKHNEE